MKIIRYSVIAIGAALLMAAPVFAQTAVQKQKTQDGASPTMVGPASGAYKQTTQSLAHGDPLAIAKKQHTGGGGGGGTDNPMSGGGYYPGNDTVATKK